MPAEQPVSGRKRNGQGQWLRLLFLLYAAAMLWLLFGQRLKGGIDYADYALALQRNRNLQPLRTLKQYWHLLQHSNGAFVRHAFINLAGNVLLFIPLGYFLPYLWKKQRFFFRCMFSALLLIVLVEVIQLFSLLGSMDVDDVILNMSGVLMGYILWKIMGKKR